MTLITKEMKKDKALEINKKKIERAKRFGEKIIQRIWDEYVTYIKYFSSNDQWYFITYKGDKEVSREKVSYETIQFSLNIN